MDKRGRQVVSLGFNAVVTCMAPELLPGCTDELRSGGKLLKKTQEYPRKFCARVVKLHLKYTDSCPDRAS